MKKMMAIVGRSDSAPFVLVSAKCVTLNIFQLDIVYLVHIHGFHKMYSYTNNIPSSQNLIKLINPLVRSTEIFLT